MRTQTLAKRIHRTAEAIIVFFVFLMPIAVNANSASDLNEAVAHIRSALDKELKDFPSARFRDVKLEIFADKSGSIACGYVNAKNSNGGFVGWQPFNVIGITNSESVALIGSDPEIFSAIETTCASSDNKWQYADISSRIHGQR